jgi:hypothetical protein
MHDEHFLERLNRLDDAEVPDALALYYDPTLVRQMLAHALQRSNAERVAISIDDPREGPFIVVTRGGDFVTTLGRGMSPGPWPIVPRSVWDDAQRNNERIRDAFARARSMTNGKLKLLWKELETRGPYVSREVMSVMLSFGRLFEDGFIAIWLDTQDRIKTHLKLPLSRDSYRALNVDTLAAVGRNAWLSGHLSVLIGASRLKERPDDELTQSFAQGHLTTRSMRLGMLGPYVRALWMVSKLGPLQLPTRKDVFRRAPIKEIALDGAIALTLIGLRFSKHRGEVRKALGIAEKPGETAADELRRACGQIGLLYLDELADRERARALLQELGAELWVSRAAELRPGHPLRFDSIEAVPPEIALPAYANLGVDVWALDGGPFFSPAVPCSCLLEAEELYYPRWATDLLETDDMAPWSQACLDRIRRTDLRRPRPVTAPALPGRNDPCSCGSGRKFKRCCGA